MARNTSKTPIYLAVAASIPSVIVILSVIRLMTLSAVNPQAGFGSIDLSLVYIVFIFPVLAIVGLITCLLAMSRYKESPYLRWLKISIALPFVAGAFCLITLVIAHLFA
ncbi:MAG: hypothetical protein AAF387_15990 [Pseudomonadota bacterium]